MFKLINKWYTIPVKIDWSILRVVEWIAATRISEGTLSPTGRRCTYGINYRITFILNTLTAPLTLKHNIAKSNTHQIHNLEIRNNCIWLIGIQLTNDFLQFKRLFGKMFLFCFHDWTSIHACIHTNTISTLSLMDGYLSLEKKRKKRQALKRLDISQIS